MEPDTTSQLSHSSAQSTPEIPQGDSPVFDKKRLIVVILIIVFLFVLLISVAGSIYFSGSQSKKSASTRQATITSRPVPATIAVSPSPAISVYNVDLTVSQAPSSISPSVSPMPLSNSAKIGDKKTILLSPDKSKIATYYYKGPVREGVASSLPDFNYVAILNKSTGKTTTYHLSGPITHAYIKLFWSPVNNRIYFTHASNGILIYALWSANPDGTDAKLVSGETDSEIGSGNGPSYQTMWDNSGMFGTEAYSFSPDGKMIAAVRDYGSSSKQSIWIMNYDGTNAHKIPIQGTYQNINNIAWKSDGQHLIFTDWNGYSQTNYAIGLSGGTPTKVTSQN